MFGFEHLHYTFRVIYFLWFSVAWMYFLAGYELRNLSYIHTKFIRKNKLILITLMMAWLFLIGGCSYHYIPRASTYPLDPITEFSSVNSISLINSQPSATEQLYAKRRSRSYYGNYQAWTNTAIKITQRELTSRNMDVKNDARKSLKMSIESVNGTFRNWAMKIEVILKVETSDGLVKKFSAYNRSAAGLKRTADGAVMRVVTKMLGDKEIVAYLKN